MENFGDLYGTEYINHNVHNLIHLPEEAKKFGALDNFSAFQFENTIHKIKLYMKTSNRPLKQLINKVDQIRTHGKVEMSVSYPQLKKEIPHFPSTINEIYYNGIMLENFDIKCESEKDSFIFTKDSYFFVKRISKLNEDINLYCQRLDNIVPYFKRPCKSTLFHSGTTTNLSQSIETVNISEIIGKCIKYKQFIIAMSHRNN